MNEINFVEFGKIICDFGVSPSPMKRGVYET